MVYSPWSVCVKQYFVIPSNAHTDTNTSTHMHAHTHTHYAFSRSKIQSVTREHGVSHKTTKIRTIKYKVQACLVLCQGYVPEKVTQIEHKILI